MLYLINTLLVINVIICLLIILLVLMQRPKNEGLGAAFGGGVTEGLFGTQTTHVLAKLTRLLGGLFFFLTLLLSFLYSRDFNLSKTDVQKRLEASATPAPVAATPAPLTPPGTPDGGVVPPTATPEGAAPVPPVTPAPEGTAPTPAPAPTIPAPEGTTAPAAPVPAPAATPLEPAPATPPVEPASRRPGADNACARAAEVASAAE